MSDTQVKSGLLEVVTTISLSATPKFVAIDNFKVNTARRAPVKISYLGSNFTAHFLAGEGKTEDPADAVELTVRKLLKNSLDKPIMDELGEKTETTLAQFYEALRLQRGGKRGALLTDGWWNIFYIRDADGTLWAVRAYWRGGGWGLRATSVAGPSAWRAGRQVGSR
jgi:hypothetical protein